MMLLYPNNALESLEFNKVTALLLQKCRTDAAKERVHKIRLHTHIEHIERDLHQTHEYKQIITGNDHFPNDFVRNISKELRLLAIEGGILSGEQLLACLQLSLTLKDIIQWFSKQGDLYTTLRQLVAGIHYEKEIAGIITPIVDEAGIIRDTASKELQQIRSDLNKARVTSRRMFEVVLRRLAKAGHLGDTGESYHNGRRTVAVRES
ncbi:MAG: hypothetical protein EBX41_09600 [Chitinophagia bacterium]|nr:hypothetical protein [Chitinophagia bacterium]